MSIDAMKQALDVLSLELPLGSHLELKSALRAAIEQAEKPRRWQGLTADEIWDVWCEQAKREFVTAFARSLEAKLKDKNL